MIVKLVFDAQFVGRMETEVDICDESTEEDIKRIFTEEFGILFDKNCSYEICGGSSLG